MLIKFRGKQKTVAKWWKMPEYRGKDAIIADGAVRSGKTLSMSLGFVIWACSSFRSGTFAMCGKLSSGKREYVQLCRDLIKADTFVFETIPTKEG